MRGHRHVNSRDRLREAGTSTLRDEAPPPPHGPGTWSPTFSRLCHSLFLPRPLHGVRAGPWAPSCAPTPATLQSTLLGHYGGLEGFPPSYANTLVKYTTNEILTNETKKTF